MFRLLEALQHDSAIDVRWSWTRAVTSPTRAFSPRAGVNAPGYNRPTSHAKSGVSTAFPSQGSMRRCCLEPAQAPRRTRVAAPGIVQGRTTRTRPAAMSALPRSMDAMNSGDNSRWSSSHCSSHSLTFAACSNGSWEMAASISATVLMQKG